ncbi:MAG TPA: efflux RND transporter permease subunit, partial [Elusimicrobiales bacterium]|nr:efflux RND transporter permease subunit [Elusimicrobiales bacterium]
PRMTERRSVSRYGISVLTLIFKDGTDIYWARQQVSEKLPEAREQAGSGAEISLGPVATAMGEIYQYTLEVPGGASTPERLAELRAAQDWVLAPAFKSIDGVSEVNSFGGYIKEYRIIPDPERMVQYGLDIPAVYEAVRDNNANVGGGISVSGGAQQIIRGLGMVSSVSGLERIVVATRGGVPVLLRDVASVAVDQAVRQGAAYKDASGEVVGGTVLLLRGANGRKVTEAVEAKAAELNAAGSLPMGARIQPFYTRSSIVRESVRTLLKAMTEGSLMVLAVLYLFLLSFRGALVAIAALPLAALLTFASMRLLDLGGNLMSLGGLAISIGMIIDSTVIQVENVMHHVRSGGGTGALERVRKAIMEVRSPSIFGELIIAVTFTPILALQGIEGKMFGPLAATVVLALLSSLLLSLLVVPALCAVFLGGGGEEGPLAGW